MHFLDPTKIWKLNNFNILSPNLLKKEIEKKINQYKKTTEWILEFIPNSSNIYKKFIDWFNLLMKQNNDLQVKSIYDLCQKFSNIDEIKNNFDGLTSETIEIFLSKIINFAHKNEKISISDYKDKLIWNYNGELIFWSFDLKNSSIDKNFKQKIWNLFWLNNIFEIIFREEWFRMFWTHWDDLYVWFFNDKLENQEKINVLLLFHNIIKKLWYETNVFLDSIEYKKENNITIVSWWRIDTTINSLNFNKSVHRTTELHKWWWFQYWISEKILKYTWLEFDIWNDFLLKDINNIYNLDEIKSALNYEDLIKINFWNSENDFIKAIIKYYSNNQKNTVETKKISNKSDINNNSEIEFLECINNIDNIIEFWEKSEYLFILIEWNLEISNLMWNNKWVFKTINEKNILIWEMSLYNNLAISNVSTKKWTKLVKLSKKDFQNILWIWENIDKVLLDPKYKKIIENYIKDLISSRMLENINIIKYLNSVEKDLWEENYNIFKAFLKNILSNKDSEIIKDKHIIDLNTKNNNIYLVKSGTILDIDDWTSTKRITLDWNTILWEWTYVNRNNPNFLPTRWIKIIDWEIKTFTFNEFDDLLNKEKIDINIVKQLFQYRDNKKFIFTF